MEGKNAVVFLRFNIYIEKNFENASELPDFCRPLCKAVCSPIILKLSNIIKSDDYKQS